MNKWIVTIIIGIAILLLAVPLGSAFASEFLALAGGMETNKYLILIEGFIRSFQIIGALTAVFGGVGIHKNEKK